MTGWSVLNNFLNSFPSVAVVLLIIVAIFAIVIFIIGFTRYGLDFIKHGLSSKPVFNELFEKLATKEDISRLELDITGMKAEIADIKVNHFGHLKNYLEVLNGILLDKGIIDNESRARLDNELRGM